MDWSDEVRARLVREEERLRYKAANLQARGKTVMAAQELVVADDIRAALEEIRRVTAERDEWKRIAHVEAKGLRCAFRERAEKAEAKLAELESELKWLRDEHMDKTGQWLKVLDENKRLRELLEECLEIFRHRAFTDRAGIGDRVEAALRGGGE